MRGLGNVFMVIGLLAVIVGLLWIGQGTGLVRWPEVSPMIDQRPWAYLGACLGVVGFVMWLIGRRMRR